MSVVNSPEHQGLSPKQIVPKLADQGIYVASESTIYRLLREHEQVQGPKAPRPRVVRAKPTQTADGPNQVWSWDITYLKSSVKGQFFYLYLVVDIWSRKLMGWEVLRREGAKHAAELISRICDDNDIDGTHLVLHSDNGAPMKGATMLATLQWLGVVPSFSRPHVKDDNAYSESLFRTLKYRPSYPKRPFKSLKEAREWVDEFVRWYNTEHLHSAIHFVTPAERHAQQDSSILAKRARVYEQARRRHPLRWTGATRDWTPVELVYLNPDLDATERRCPQAPQALSGKGPSLKGPPDSDPSKQATNPHRLWAGAPCRN